MKLKEVGIIRGDHRSSSGFKVKIKGSPNKEVQPMKTLTKTLVLTLLVAFVFASCAKQPTQEMDASKAAIQAIVDAKGTLYAPAELKKLNDDLAAANDEVAAQSKKFFKSYKKAKELLAAVITDADAAKALIPARVEEAKNAALAAQTEAKTAFDEAKALLDKAPKGKGTKADIEAMKADLGGLETQLVDVQTAIDGMDYFGAKDKAVAIKDGAAKITEAVNAAIAKVKGR